jgi:hypothetical protein
MSAFGPKRTWPRALHMSALGGKADMTFRGSPLLRSLFGVKRTCRFATLAHSLGTIITGLALPFSGPLAELTTCRSKTVTDCSRQQSSSRQKKFLGFLKSAGTHSRFPELSVCQKTALAALVVIAGASLYRAGTVWLLIAAIVVAIWGGSRLFVSSHGFCCR